VSARRLAVIPIVLSLSLSMALAARSAAAPPVLTSVGASDSEVTARWTLPSGVGAQFVQIATNPSVTEYGYFLERNLVSFSALGRYDRTFRDTLQLQPGTYYVHVAGSDKTCYPDCPRIEFSESWRVRIDATGAAQGTNLAQEGVPPSQFVYCRRKQPLRSVWVKGRMDINGSLTATGKLTARSAVGRSRSFKVGPVTKTAAADKTVRIALKLSKAAERAARRSLAAGRTPKLGITITARDGAGRTAHRAISVRLTR
jgi:hypothetical protein